MMLPCCLCGSYRSSITLLSVPCFSIGPIGWRADKTSGKVQADGCSRTKLLRNEAG